MDQLDFDIIKILMHNSRTPFSTISKELGVSTDTIIRRYDKLKETGVIKPIVNVDIFKLGYGARVWYMISLMHQVDTSATVQEIAKIKDVIRAVKSVGDYDLLVIAAVKDFKHMFEIGRELKKINGVLQIEARQYLPSPDPNILKAAPSGFFNPNLLDKKE
ncbi:MAG: Lrp/AsnC family transcriptional regulator [archaeon]|nr:Lrp/AsnC family transcriptional regulator [Candidatus Bathyarchaeum sp.]